MLPIMNGKLIRDQPSPCSTAIKSVRTPVAKEAPEQDLTDVKIESKKHRGIGQQSENQR